MICPHCGTDIADKALICYRCGTATTEPRVTPPVAGPLFARPRRGRWSMPLVVALLIAVALAFYLTLVP